MEELNKYEHELRSQSDQAEVSPPAFIWDAVEEQLPTKKRRQIWWLWMSLLLILFLATYATLSYLNIDKEPNHTAVQYEETPATNKNGTFDSKIISSISENPNKSESLETDNPLDQSIQELANAERDFNIKLPTTSAKSTQLAKKTATIINQDRVNPSYQSIINTNQFQEKSNAIKTATQRTIENNKEAQLPMPSEKLVKGKQDASLTMLEKLKGNITFLEIPTIELDSLDLISSISHPHEEIRKYFVEPSVFLGAHDMTFSGSNANNHNTTEQNWYTVGAGVKIGTKLGKHWHISTGLEYFSIRNQFSYQKTGVTMDILNDSLQNYRVNTGTYFSRGDVVYQHYNIPIQLGYSKDVAGVRLGFEARLAFNLLQQTEGKYLISPMLIRRIEEDNIYKARVGLSIGLSGLAEFGLSRHTSLVLRPQIIRYNAPLSKENQVVETRLWVYGLGMGIKHMF